MGINRYDGAKMNHFCVVGGRSSVARPPKPPRATSIHCFLLRRHLARRFAADELARLAGAVADATGKAACAAAFIVHHKAGRCCLRVGHHVLQP